MHTYTMVLFSVISDHSMTLTISWNIADSDYTTYHDVDKQNKDKNINKIKLSTGQIIGDYIESTVWTLGYKWLTFLDLSAKYYVIQRRMRNTIPFVKFKHWSLWTTSSRVFVHVRLWLNPNSLSIDKVGIARLT